MAHPRTPSLRPHVDSPTTAAHVDVYESELGPGCPVYNPWVIEDDGSWERDQLEAEKLGPPLLTEAHPPFRTPAGRPSSNELWRFRRRGCQDCWAALFFVATLAVVSLWGISEIYHFYLTPEMMAGPDSWLDKNAFGGAGISPEGSTLGKRTASPRSEPVSGRSAAPEQNNQALLITDIVHSKLVLQSTMWLGLFGTASFITAFLSLSVLGMMPRALIYLQCYGQSFAFAVVAGYSLVSGSLGAALIGAFFATMPLLWLYLVRDRIPFAAAMLVTASHVLKRHAGLLVVAAGISLSLAAYFLLSIFWLLPPMLRAAVQSPWPRDSVYVLLLLFAAFWVQQVLTNVMHVTVSGVVATWYFAGDSFMPPSPIAASLCRAVTSSLGSICFGSLLVAIVRWVRYLAHASNADSQGGLLSCVCLCLLDCVEGLLEYFNTYAFVHVAIYGCNYTDAARETFRLTQQCFFAAVFNDCLAGQAVDMLNWFLSFTFAAVAGIVSWSASVGVMIFVIALFVNTVIFQMVHSTVTTIFVCYAEVPEALQVSFPALYEELHRTDAGMTQSLYGTV